MTDALVIRCITHKNVCTHFLVKTNK